MVRKLNKVDKKYTWYKGSCHCGNIEFEIATTNHLTVTLCNCDICFKSGHQELMVPEDRYKLHKGKEFLKEYRFGNCVADHTFCVVCGVMPFYRPRSHPEGFFSVNARCIKFPDSVRMEYVDFDGQNWEESIASGSHKVTE